MALREITASQPTTPTLVPPVCEDTKPAPICLEELTSLQRQRLDTAVMMLVNYLVSASTGK